MRWYVKVSRKGRRIGISEEYGTPAFDAAYEAAVAALGGVMRMRRVKGTVKPDQPGRRYLYVDVSQRGHVRYYVQQPNKLPKVRIKAEPRRNSRPKLTKRSPSKSGFMGDQGDYINAQKQRNEARPALPTTATKPGTLCALSESRCMVPPKNASGRIVPRTRCELLKIAGGCTIICLVDGASLRGPREDAGGIQ
jgi:hypothetical protein